jgi:hypothetical protein
MKYTYNNTKIFIIILLLFQNCSNDFTKDLGDGYFYRFEGGELNDILGKGEIPATVLEYAFNDDFIIAEQKPKLPQDPLYDNEYNYNNGANSLYYWIIIKKQNLVLGPFSYLEYIKVKNENKITLKFQKEK